MAGRGLTKEGIPEDMSGHFADGRLDGAMEEVRLRNAEAAVLVRQP